MKSLALLGIGYRCMLYAKALYIHKYMHDHYPGDDVTHHSPPTSCRRLRPCVPGGVRYALTPTRQPNSVSKATTSEASASCSSGQSTKDMSGLPFLQHIFNHLTRLSISTFRPTPTLSPHFRWLQDPPKPAVLRRSMASSAEARNTRSMEYYLSSDSDRGNAGIYFARTRLE